MFKRADDMEIQSRRTQLGIPDNAFTLLYCGSLGPQYGIKEMMYIHKKLYESNNNSFLLLLATNPEAAERYGVLGLSNVILRKVSFSEVPNFLSLGNVALAIRQPAFSMHGVAPIKLGEYLLTGLPTIASAGIGDTEEVLSGKRYAFVLKDHTSKSLDEAVNWIKKLAIDERLMNMARLDGEKYFSLNASAESYRAALQNL
jgi:hypothetical protein